MIEVFANSGYRVPVEKINYPDGTVSLKVNVKDTPVEEIECFHILWRYESDAEFMQLYFLTNHLRQYHKEINLSIPYIPNARMDRVYEYNEVFTLKYFAKLINSLNFSKVQVLDPHSNVSAALIDNIVINNAQYYIKRVLKAFREKFVEDPVIYFSDESAMKKYTKLDCLKGLTYLYGAKVRDWETGKIIGLNIIDMNNRRLDCGCDFCGDKVILIDDIISYGGTMKYGIKELVSMNFDPVYVYATHTEYKSYNDENRGDLKKLMKERNMLLFTTDSIYFDKERHDVCDDNTTVFKTHIVCQKN